MYYCLKPSEGPLCTRPHPDAGTPARSAAARVEPAGRPGQVPGQVGRQPRRALGGKPRVAGAGPRRAQAGRAGQPPTVQGISSPLPHSARSARCPSSGTRGYCESLPAVPAVTHAHAAQTTPGSREASAKPPGARKSRQSVSQGAASPKAASQLCLRRCAEPTVPTHSGMRAPLAGRAGRSLPGPRRPHPWGGLSPPRRVRALGAPHWDCGARRRWPPTVSKPARHVRFRPLAGIVFGPQ